MNLSKLIAEALWRRLVVDLQAGTATPLPAAPSNAVLTAVGNAPTLMTRRDHATFKLYYRYPDGSVQTYEISVRALPTPQRVSA